jgi:kinesin family protein 5
MPKITVGIRLKPEESVNVSKNIIVRDESSIDLHVSGSKHEFQYDKIFSANADQATVFKKSTAHIIDEVLEGFNGCVLTYGQTGAGEY